MMRNRLLLLVLGLALIGAGTEIWAASHIVEQAVETTALSVSLPDRDTGSMAVKSCPSCKPMLLRLTPSSKFLVGGTQVPYSEFLALARGSTDYNLGIFYDRKSSTITRLSMPGARRAAPKRRTRST